VGTNSRNRETRRGAAKPSASTPFALAAAVALLAALSCGDDTSPSKNPSAIGTTPIATPASAAAATERAVDQATGRSAAEAAPSGESGATAKPIGMRHPPLTADEFLDAPGHRDPFAPFVPPRPETTLATNPTPELPVAPIATPQKVIFPDIDIEDLKCRMVLALAGEKPRAYLLAPNGEHAYVRQGDYVGRAIRSGPNEPEVHWRVYEVQEGGVSFELSNAAPDQGDTGVRPALRLYTLEEMRSFENLFSLR